MMRPLDLTPQICFWMSSAMPFLLHYLTFLCTTLKASLAVTVTGERRKDRRGLMYTGQIRTTLQTVIGLFAFGGIELNFAMSLGLLTSTLGQCGMGRSSTIKHYVHSIEREGVPGNSGRHSHVSILTMKKRLFYSASSIWSCLKSVLFSLFSFIVTAKRVLAGECDHHSIHSSRKRWFHPQMQDTTER